MEQLFPSEFPVSTETKCHLDLILEPHKLCLPRGHCCHFKVISKCHKRLIKIRPTVWQAEALLSPLPWRLFQHLKSVKGETRAPQPSEFQA